LTLKNGKRHWLGNTNDNLFMKEASLFVLFVFYVEISETTAPLAMLLVPLESPWWIGVHQLGFIMFGPMVEELLNIEQKFY
jgi:hypothetical protein